MERFRKLMDKFSGKKVVVVGDVMLDRYVHGEAKRISVEAPVVILRKTLETYVPGGAANVASNIASLHGSPSLFGIIGDDEKGRILCDKLEQAGVNFFPSFDKKTIDKERIVAAGQQLLRVDDEESSFSVNLNESALESEVKNSELIVVSDYAKGTIRQNTIEKLKSFKKRIIVDTKPVNYLWFNDVSLLKVNEDEALGITGLKDVYASGEKIRQTLNSDILVTRGSKGALLFDGSVKEFSAMAREVYDVTGAGDTVLATIAISLAAGSNMSDAINLANHAAGIKVEKFGTAAITLSELEKRIFKEESKIKTREELKEIISDYHKQGKTVAWTNGCFDILHQGHVRYLKQAAEYGDVLVVGLNSDESVRQLKGQGHPRQNQDARAEILSAIEVIDYITIFPDMRVTSLMKYLQPDIFVKGGDYVESPEEHVPGKQVMDQDERKAIRQYGGKIKFIPVEVNISTSKIIQDIRDGK
jgi:D-beta-D-heptose 7-phosphate kinase/D-beta-D-heptose 1-phosphate adenosyltransferase